MTSSDRLAPLGLEAKNYTFDWEPAKMDLPFDQKPMSAGREMPYLKDVERGIKIFYPSLNGAGVEYYTTKKSWEFWTRTRLAKPTSNAKYLSEKGAGLRIFLPRNTLIKVRQKETFDTLHIVEGEIKAIFGDFHGLDIVGIPGIHMFIAHKGSADLHPTIRQIIENCGVQRINLLLDADACHVPIKDFAEKDLSERLISFHSSVKKFKYAVANYNKPIEDNNLVVDATGEGAKKSTVTPYFSHIRTEFVNDAKGLDDLYIYKGNEMAGVINEELGKLTKAKEFFYCENLKAITLETLKKRFYLDVDNIGAPKGFYSKFSDEIQDNKFYFFGNQYKYDESADKIICTYHKTLNEFVRIGTDYFKNVVQTFLIADQNNHEVPVRKKMLEKWSKAEIQEDFIKGMGLKNAFQIIPKYDAFCNIPAHANKYNRIINEKEYNLYHPLNFNPEPGEWPNIEKYLKHVSQNDYQDKYDVLLDYMALKFNKPIMKLPILVLYSKEKGTGKSTFLWLMNDIFGDNAHFVTNKDLEDNFNEYLLGNVMLLDEITINEKVWKFLQSLSTAPITSLNMKNMSRKKIQFFSSMIMTTNKLNFISIDRDENRFFVLKVPVLEGNNLDPDLQAKMRNEVPAFCHYLMHSHKMSYPDKKTRFWFPYKTMVTDSLKEFKFRSQRMAFKAINTWVREMFFGHRCNEFYATNKIIRQEIRQHTNREITHSEIDMLLKDEYALTSIGSPRPFTYPEHEDTMEGVTTKWQKDYYDPDKKKRVRCMGDYYTIRADEFLDFDEIEKLNEALGKPVDEENPF